ncbi:hypothetical protein PUN28_005268 [Cardiocondyla obscurior]|uniref:Uncharacterized protein n=1 Tax=Cardiocondyla obscurior TaxID=286306 RepID=A0AAW2GGM4_9HYME
MRRFVTTHLIEISRPVTPVERKATLLSGNLSVASITRFSVRGIHETFHARAHSSTNRSHSRKVLSPRNVRWLRGKRCYRVRCVIGREVRREQPRDFPFTPLKHVHQSVPRLPLYIGFPN